MYSNRDLQEQGNEKQRLPGSRSSGSLRHQGPPGERKNGARASRSEKARSKIKSVVRFNDLAGFDTDTQDPTKSSGEDPEKCSKEE